MAIFHSSVELPEVDVLLQHGCAEHPPSIDVFAASYVLLPESYLVQLHVYNVYIYIYCVDHQDIQ